jgi:hypothetical protein
MSGQDFTLHIAGVCPSGRQIFRVMLVDYLTMQFPDVDAGAQMTTANNAIALAQKDIVTAFIRHNEAPKQLSPNCQYWHDRWDGTEATRKYRDGLGKSGRRVGRNYRSCDLGHSDRIRADRANREAAKTD